MCVSAIKPTRFSGLCSELERPRFRGQRERQAVPSLASRGWSSAGLGQRCSARLDPHWSPPLGGRRDSPFSPGSVSSTPRRSPRFLLPLARGPAVAPPPGPSGAPIGRCGEQGGLRASAPCPPRESAAARAAGVRAAGRLHGALRAAARRGPARRAGPDAGGPVRLRRGALERRARRAGRPGAAGAAGAGRQGGAVREQQQPARAARAGPPLRAPRLRGPARRAGLQLRAVRRAPAAPAPAPAAGRAGRRVRAGRRGAARRAARRGAAPGGGPRRGPGRGPARARRARGLRRALLLRQAERGVRAPARPRLPARGHRPRPVAPAQRRQPDPRHREPGCCSGDSLRPPGPGGGQAQPLHVRVYHRALQRGPCPHAHGGRPPGDRHPLRPPLWHDHAAHAYGCLPPGGGPGLPGVWPARPRAPLLCGEHRGLDGGVGGLSPPDRHCSPTPPHP